MPMSPRGLAGFTNRVPLDFTDRYNTQLTPQEEKLFQAWASSLGKLNDLQDYDLRGAWKSNPTMDARGHLPDTYKKPNHPTFSNESIYSGMDGYVGGTWSRMGNRDVFSPNMSNVLSRQELADYFRQYEPNAILLDTRQSDRYNPQDRR